MSYTLNRKIKELEPYEPIQGCFSIRLDANESFLSVPKKLREEFSNIAAQMEYNRYPDPMAQELCTSFAQYYGISSENVTAGNGSDELISVIQTAFLLKGEPVLVTAPDFSMYSFYASISEANCVVLPKEPDLSVSVEKLIQKANDIQARMILFSNPCNPTSLGLTREDVRKLITSVSALVVLDEAYMDFWDQSLLNEVNQYDNLIILRTCSKAFGMAAVRLGFAVANATLTKALRAVKSPYNVNMLTQKFGTAVLNQKQLCTEAVQTILDSKASLYQALKSLETQFQTELQVYESCTNFVFLKTLNARQLFQSLLQTGIVVRCFDPYLRVTAGTETENKAFLENFERLLREIKG